MIDLNKYVVTNNPGQALHSNGYAEVANAGRIGAVGGSSFTDRLKTNQTRRSVGSYDRSIIGRNYGSQRAQSVSSGQTRPAGASRWSPNQSAETSPVGFREPMARPHNPYA